MILLQNYLDDFSKRADTENVKIQVLGDVTALSKGLQNSINKSIERTKDNTGIVFNVAFNYNYDAEYIIATLIYSEEDEERKNYLFEKFVLNDPNIEPAYLFGSLCEVPELEYRLMDKYFLCKGNKMTVQKAVDLIDYNGDKVDFFKNYPNIVDYFVEQFEIKNKKHFEYIIKKFGNKTFTFLNDNIVNLINLNDEDFNKIMAIFEKENLSLDRVSTEAVITSIVQKRFMIDKNNIYNIFSSFESWINKKDLESIEK